MHKVRRIIVRILLVSVVGISLLLAFVKVTRGMGDVYPDLSTAPLFGSDALEVAAELPLPPGNVAVAADGRMFFNYHYLGGKSPQGYSVFELINNQPVPYPNTAFQSEFKTTLGMLIDSQQRLWVIDPAGLEQDRRTRLMAFDLATNTLVYDYTFSDDDADFAQDVQVSSDGRMVYLASTGVFRFIKANLIVLDTKTNVARTLLKGDSSVEPQAWRIHTQSGEGVQVFWGLIDWQAGVDGIALTKNDEWLYYGAINHDTLYRIKTEYLLDTTLDDIALAAKIEAVGKKPLSDGYSIDLDGNVYLTDVEHGAITRMSESGELVTLVKDSRVRWADGISFGPNNMIYFTDSAISDYLTPTADPSSLDIHAEKGPYYIFKFQNDRSGIAGS